MQLVRQLRRQGMQVPIYATTANVGAASLSAYKAAGFNGVLAKPFRAE